MLPIRSTKIGRNELCPCGSKKKYKFCHGGVNAVPPLKPGQLDSQLRQLTHKAACLAPESLHSNCKGKVISSHTVSRSGSLGEIAKGSHVYSYKLSVHKIHELHGKIEPQLVGWKEASTFPGFCAHHDKDLFSPLEDQKFLGNQHQCFLLGYRSIAWEWYAKQRAAHHNQLRAALAASKEPDLQAMMADFNYMTELGLRDIDSHKTTYDEVLASERWFDCHGLLVEFDQLFPIQCSAAWSPTEDIHGTEIQELGLSPRTPETATITSFAADGKSYFLLSWLSDSAAVASNLADSIVSISKANLPAAIAALLLLTSENCHLSPTWYDALTKSGKNWVNFLAHPLDLGKPSPANAGGIDHIGGIGVTSLSRF